MCHSGCFFSQRLVGKGEICGYPHRHFDRPVRDNEEEQGRKGDIFGFEGGRGGENKQCQSRSSWHMISTAARSTAVVPDSTRCMFRFSRPENQACRP